MKLWHRSSRIGSEICSRQFPICEQ